METWRVIAIFFIGIAFMEFIVILLFRNKIGDSNEINIKRQVQRNRKSPNNKQEYNSEIKDDHQNKKGIFKRLKRKKHGNTCN